MTNLLQTRWGLRKKARCENWFKRLLASIMMCIVEVVLMIHCGSRGFGHQVATDALVSMEKAMKRDNIEVKPLLKNWKFF